MSGFRQDLKRSERYQVGIMAESITLFISISVFIAGIVSYYGAVVKKQYASERDFNHLKNNYQALAENVATLSDMLDSRLDQISLTIMKVEARQDIILSQTRDAKVK